MKRKMLMRICLCVAVLLFSVDAFAAVATPSLPTPDIKANGQDGPITVTDATTVSISAGLDPGNENGVLADWWLAANTPFGWYSLTLNGWTPGIHLLAQYPLFSLSPVDILSASLPAGDYAFCFLMDMSPNGIVDSPYYYDTVQIHVDYADISQITEMSSKSKDIVAAQGGTIVHDEFTADFRANILPVDAQMKASKVSVSNSKQDPSLIDMTNAYVISTTSSTQPLELVDSATLSFKINPAGFDPASILLVVWNGYSWDEAPAQYDESRQIVSSTVQMILPFGTRIYSANPAKKSARPGVHKDRMTISEFVAVKVVGSPSNNAVAISADATRDAESSPAKAKKIESANFTVQYYQEGDEAQARAVSEYMENAYTKIVGEMGLRKPGPSSKIGYKKTWPVEFEEQGDAYARADDGNNIYVQPGTAPGDDLSHTCHHEFTHLVQYKTLRDAGNKTDDGLSWFDETMADAVGFYAQKGLGVIYSAPDTDMGDFDMRLDSDEFSITNNDDYEYVHFPFISYLLAKYGHGKFKNFFETYYSYTPGKEKINMTTIDTVASNVFEKTLSGREGLYWDFYWDYFISGIVFNKDKFKNLPGRSSGAPYEITEDNKDGQGATIVEVVSGTVYQPKDFTLLRLSGQVAVFRYAGTSEASLTLSVTVNSSPGQSSGHIQLVSFKKEGGALQSVGTPEDVSDGAQITKNYAGFGKEIHEIYVVMTNTNSQTDGYKVTVGATATP